MRSPVSLAAAAALFMLVVAVQPSAQAGPPPPQGRGGGGRATFPAQQRPAGDPALIARGNGLYGVHCRACHGVDLRGGDQGGPNLLRSNMVLNDQAGELIAPVILNGQQGAGSSMPPIRVTQDDARAIAEYLHSVAATMRGQGNPPPGPAPVLNVLVGDAAAGEVYFNAKCGTCHSADWRSARDRLATWRPHSASELLDFGRRRTRARRTRRTWPACTSYRYIFARTESRRNAGSSRRLLRRRASSPTVRSARSVATESVQSWTFAILWSHTGNCCRRTPTRTFTT